MNSWYDYIDPGVLLDAAGWVVATCLGLYGIWLAKNESRVHLFLLGGFSFLGILVAIGYISVGVQTLRSNRDKDHKIDTLLALSGLPSSNINQGLDQLITRNLQPRQIIPTQEEALANAIELFKGMVPKRFAITNFVNPTQDTYEIRDSIQRAFAQNGINVGFGNWTASTPQETGIMFTMPEPRNPSEFALKLRDAFGLAGIHDIRFVSMTPEMAATFDLTIFIGPAPLK